MPSAWILDPNVVYVALVIGLWIGVTAVYMPGTWIPEIIAIILSVGSIFALMMMPTNWIALVVLIVGVAAFLVLPFVGERYMKYAEAGLVLQALGGYFLFENQVVSPLLIGFTVLFAVLYHRLVLIPTIRNQRKRSEFDDSIEVIGVRGRVVSELNPVGTIYVNKELWRARSEEYLPKDTPVIVVAQDGLELLVEKSKREDAPEYPNHMKNGVSA